MKRTRLSIPTNTDVITMVGRKFAMAPGVKADSTSYTRNIIEGNQYLGFITVRPGTLGRFYSPRAGKAFDMMHEAIAAELGISA